VFQGLGSLADCRMTRTCRSHNQPVQRLFHKVSSDAGLTEIPAAELESALAESGYVWLDLLGESSEAIYELANLLDLDRVDVLAAADDHVVDAARHPEVALGVPGAHVAGEVPALAQRPGVGVGPVTVSAFGSVADDASERTTVIPYMPAGMPAGSTAVSTVALTNVVLSAP